MNGLRMGRWVKGREGRTEGRKSAWYKWAVNNNGDGRMDGYLGSKALG